MTAIILPREYGVKLICNRCGTSEQTAMCGRKKNREWFRGLGWGRGSDRGTKHTDRGQNRQSTINHDLCPECLKLDLEAIEERRKARNERIATKDAKLKARDAARKATTP